MASGDVLPKIGTDTIGNIGTGVQAAGVIASTVGAYNKSESDANAYEYQSKIASNNAMLAEWQASDATRRGATTANLVRQKGAKIKGMQTAEFAARGVDLGIGSPLNILTDTDFNTGVDVATASDNTSKEVYALQMQAANYRSNAGLLKQRADDENPLLAAGGTLLTGAASVASGWYSRNKVPTYPTNMA